MTPVAPTGMGAFEFTNSNGSHVSIPLTAFSFDVSGNLIVNPNWQTIFNTAPAIALMAYLRAQGLIVPAPAASPKPAAIIKASDPGAGGNNISVTVAIAAPNADPSKTTFNITVTETETYTGLTTASISGVIGTTSGGGTQPGLVHIKSIANPAGVPASLSPTNLIGGNPTTKASLPINDAGSALVFTLEARDPGSDGDLITINITPTGATFGMTVQWTKTAPGVTISTFQSQVASNLSYEITAAAPTGGVFSVPAALTTNLSGGASSVNASAILVAGQ